MRPLVFNQTNCRFKFAARQPQGVTPNRATNQSANVAW